MNDDERRDLAAWAYQGEIVGQALFGTLADLQSDPERRAWLTTLCELEARVAVLLEPFVEELGVEPRASPESRLRGERMAQWSHEAGWVAFLESFEPVTQEALAKYRRLLELTDERNASTVQTLIEHEEALREFAQLACAGEGEPLSPVSRVLGGLRQ
jgi:hypothetical protein